MKSLLILCQPDDVAAFRLAEFCRRRDLPTIVVTGVELAAAPAWHVQTSTAGTMWRIGLADGTVLSPLTVAGIYCRLLGVWSPYAFAAPEDTNYAASELQALITGWLRNAEVPLLGPVSPVQLAQPPTNGWLRLQQMAAAGLPVPATACLTAPQQWAGLPDIPFSALHPEWPNRTGTWLQEPLLPDVTTAVAVDKAIFHAPDPELIAPLQRLQESLDVPFVAVPFARNTGGAWRAVGYHFLLNWATDEECAAFVEFAKSRLRQSVSASYLQPVA
ncbi:hypothetical protein [Hymenobacter sp. BT491]|uniref:hypothetical protein n=1 Tax=Hymenobacter sp. BT491 TaxID=2766779 RepID=UPI001653CE0A|nr:hypothetical protein [Hymenobacter sp. BT491]MBC6990394.1 hypothetical protein [Hymenobacter sp. BT491]